MRTEKEALSFSAAISAGNGELTADGFEKSAFVGTVVFIAERYNRRV